MFRNEVTMSALLVFVLEALCSLPHPILQLLFWNT